LFVIALGSGIVVDGKVLYGNDGFAGELGHTIVEDNGRQCGCGRKGCLETYVSATGIVSTVKQLVETSENSNDVTELLQKEITAHNIYIAATNGNKIALNAFEYTGEDAARAWKVSGTLDVARFEVNLWQDKWPLGEGPDPNNQEAKERRRDYYFTDSVDGVWQDVSR